MAGRTRGSGVWIDGRIVYWRDRGGRQRQRTARSVVEARRLAVEIGDAVARGEDWSPVEPRRATALDELTEGYLRDLVTRAAPRTVRSYARSLDEWLAWLAATGRPLDVTSLDRAMLQDWRAHLLVAPGRHGRVRSTRSAEKIHQPAALAWAWASTAGRWPDIPAPRSLPPLRRARATARRSATWYQVDRMLAELRQVRGYGEARVPAGVAADWQLRAALLARYTGGRRLELLQLRPADVDLADGRLWIRAETTKGEAGGRVVPLHPALAELVVGWLDGETLCQAPALELTGRGHVDRSIRRAWRRSGAPPEVYQGQPLHGSRRAMRTHLVREGVHRDVIDLLLGHALGGTGGRVYTDAEALWPALVRAIATVPGEGEATEAQPWGVR